MEELRQAALQYISSAELADLDELTSSINARLDEMADEANEVVLAAHNGDTERLRALLKANPNLVDAVRRAKFAPLVSICLPHWLTLCLCAYVPLSLIPSISTLHYTCCYDEIKGNQDLQICFHAHFLILSHSISFSPVT